MHIVDRLVDAYNEKNIDGFVDCCSPEVIVENAIGEQVCEGANMLRETYQPIFEGSPDIQTETTHRTDLGEYVVDERITTGVNIGDMPSNMKSVTVYRVVDGLIAHMRLIG
jgi:hypothetical protein